MTTYILQTIIFQMVFLALYELLLKKETFFQWNRVYLLLTPLIALVLPLIKIEALQSAVPQNFILNLPEVKLGTPSATAESSLATSGASLSLLEIILILGMAISTLLFVYKLYKIFQLKRKGKREAIERATIVNIPNSTDAFSFAGTIFLGESLNQKNKEYILAHEQVHIMQKHYLDLLYFEMLRIVLWFNPLVYLYQKRIATLHEYIADAEVASQSEKKSYYQNLLSEVFKTHTVSFVNTFFSHSLIKKRIVMLHKSKSKKTQLIKYVFLLPVVAGMLLATSCEQTENNPKEVETVNPIVTIDTIWDSKELKLDVPFAVIDQVPIYPGCENLSTNEERKRCISEKIDQLVMENFNTSIFDGSGLNTRMRASVQFKIDDQGNVVDILSRAPNNLLEKEAKRVISLLPKMQPGKHKGKAVGVLYSLPIIFESSK